MCGNLYKTSHQTLCPTNLSYLTNILALLSCISEVLFRILCLTGHVIMKSSLRSARQLCFAIHRSYGDQFVCLTHTGGQNFVTSLMQSAIVNTFVALQNNPSTVSKFTGWLTTTSWKKSCFFSITIIVTQSSTVGCGTKQNCYQKQTRAQEVTSYAWQQSRHEDRKFKLPPENKASIILLFHFLGILKISNLVTSSSSKDFDFYAKQADGTKHLKQILL